MLSVKISLIFYSEPKTSVLSCFWGFRHTIQHLWFGYVMLACYHVRKYLEEGFPIFLSRVFVHGETLVALDYPEKIESLYTCVFIQIIAKQKVHNTTK